jgi:hypothetical protein
MEKVKNELKTFLTPADSFAILFSNLNYPPPIPGLRAGTDEQLDIAFWNGEEKLLSYTNLPQLLEKGIQFAQEQSTPVNILLISNSSQFGSNLVANDILRNVLERNTEKSPIHVFDFCQTTTNYLVNGRYFKNNEYLYLNLTQTTGGSFIREPLVQNFSNALANVLKLTLKQVNGFDLHLKVDQGIAYGKHVLMANPESFAAQDIYTQTGLFRGRFPITVELSGEINRQIFHAQFDILQNESVSMDSSARTVWFADALFKQEGQNPNNVVIQDIIYKSIENRILTKYTAFLCLEDSSYYCPTCRDETGIPTANEEESIDSLTRLLAFPNPFHDRINIELHSGDPFKKQSAPARIMDLQGRIIRRFDVDHAFHDGITQYIWDGKDDSGMPVPSGAYVLEIQIGNKILYEKLIRF